jgi:cytochrome c-type biogenesis protein CcmH/NrfF
VLADINAGVSEQAIVAYLQSRYPGIVLRPSAGGLEGIVWFAPLIGFVVAIAVIGRMFWRKRSRPLQVRVGEADRLLVAEALVAANRASDGAPDPARPARAEIRQ